MREFDRFVDLDEEERFWCDYEDQPFDIESKESKERVEYTKLTNLQLYGRQYSPTYAKSWTIHGGNFDHEIKIRYNE